MLIRSVDIGGSGVKTALFESSKHYDTPKKLTETQFFDNPDFDNFAPWLSYKVDNDFDVLGVSCPGIIQDDIVARCYIANWQNKDLINELSTQYSAEAVLLNDAEAHLMANVVRHTYPLMGISLGTSFGFAMTDSLGILYRSPKLHNFEIGGMVLKSSANNPQVWYALGSKGLKDLQEEKGEMRGARHFGYRLGAFLLQLNTLFAPAHIVISGGIAQTYADTLLEAIQQEFVASQQDTLPQVHISPYGRDTALWGMAYYAWLMDG